MEVPLTRTTPLNIVCRPSTQPSQATALHSGPIKNTQSLEAKYRGPASIFQYPWILQFCSVLEYLIPIHNSGTYMSCNGSKVNVLYCGQDASAEIMKSPVNLNPGPCCCEIWVLTTVPLSFYCWKNKTHFGIQLKLSKNSSHLFSSLLIQLKVMGLLKPDLAVTGWEARYVPDRSPVSNLRATLRAKKLTNKF